MKVTVLVRNDDPERNKIGVYKKYVRVLHEDGAGYYVLINNMKAYVYYDGSDIVFVRYWG